MSIQEVSIQETIENKLKQAFEPQYLLVENESYHHNVPAGSQSHFKVIVVSEQFADKSLLQRHRLINQCLQNELKHDIHALAIHAFTPSQWQDKQDKLLASPPCHGGGK